MSRAILLAGGKSVRMGRDKPLLELDGETLVERHLRQLKSVGVDEALVVCNRENEVNIRLRTGVRTALQRGDGMSAAVLTGLDEDGPAWIVCVNDIIGDCDYLRIAEAAQAGLAIPTRPLERAFSGGHLVIENGRVVRIVEKPRGGCPPGAAANIMVHRWADTAVLKRFLAEGIEYEDAVNRLIEEGLHVVPVTINFWTAIKTPDDLAIVKRRRERKDSS